MQGSHLCIGLCESLSRRVTCDTWCIFNECHTRPPKLIRSVSIKDGGICIVRNSQKPRVSDAY